MKEPQMQQEAPQESPQEAEGYPRRASARTRARAQRRSRVRGLCLTALCLIVGVIYSDLLTLGFAGTPLHGETLLYVFLFGASLGLFAFFLISVFPGRHTGTILLIVLYALLALYYCIQIFCKSSYFNYMSLSSLLGGTDGVVKEYGDVVVRIVLRGLWRIVLLYLPLALMLVGKRLRLLRVERIRFWKCAVILALSVLLFFGGVLAVNGSSRAKERYRGSFEFDSAVGTFGLHEAARLDLHYLLFGNESAQAFETLPTLPPTQPVQTEEKPPATDATEPVGGEALMEPVSTEPEPIVYGYNEMDIDFSALAEAESSDAIRSVHSYVASLSPSQQNEYTGLFRGKNLILITAEAFSAEAIRPDLTPTLYRMATKGIQVKEYYQPAWGGSTSTGEYSNVVGLVPTQGVQSIRTAANNNLYFTLGNQCQRLGYFTGAYHDHFYRYYNRDETHRNLGYHEYLGRGNGLEDQIADTWPESDLELMQATVDRYIDQQPFSVYYMTVSGHANYSWGGNYMSAKNRDAVQGLDCSETVKAYYASQLELEYGLRYLIDRLEKAGIADDTVIVLATDHYPYGLEDSDAWGTSGDALAELYGYSYRQPWERDHSALLIWSGCLEEMDPIVVEGPTYSLDIVPTLSTLFGMEYDSRLLVGRDILSDTEPLALWPDGSWRTDKASYNAAKDEYTVFEGAQVDEDYFERLRITVKNKRSFSSNVLERDYYAVLFGKDEIT